MTESKEREKKEKKEKNARAKIKACPPPTLLVLARELVGQIFGQSPKRVEEVLVVERHFFRGSGGQTVEKRSENTLHAPRHGALTSRTRATDARRRVPDGAFFLSLCLFREITDERFNVANDIQTVRGAPHQKCYSFFSFARAIWIRDAQTAIPDVRFGYFDADSRT